MESGRVFSLDEISRHSSTREGLWIVIRGVVYDVTQWAQSHPGGVAVIERCSGRDATVDFDEVCHSSYAIAMLPKFAIGTVAARPAATPNAAKPAPRPKEKTVVLDSISAKAAPKPQSTSVPWNAILFVLLIALAYNVWWNTGPAADQ